MANRGELHEDKPFLRARQGLADRLSAGHDTELAQLRAKSVDATGNMSPTNEAPTTAPVSGANTWIQLGPVAIPNGQTHSQNRVRVTGRITAIQIDPQNSSVIYVAAARGGVWKTIDGGSTWQPKSDHEKSLAIGALAIAPSAPNVLYAGTGEGNVHFFSETFPFGSIRESYHGCGVLATTDGGEHWTLQGEADFTGACFYRIAVHPMDPNVAFAASNKGLYRTVNGGQQWLAITDGLLAISGPIFAVSDVAIDPFTPNTVYVAFFGGGVYRTANAHDERPSWTPIPGLGAKPGRIALSVAPSCPEAIYALTEMGRLYLMRYVDTAPFFQEISGLGLADRWLFNSYHLNISVDPTTSDVVYLSGLSIYRAVLDAGSGAWSARDIGANIHADNHALAFDPDPARHLTVYTGNDGGIYRSTDGGDTWDDWINAGLCITQFEFIAQHPASEAMIIGGTQDNGTEQFRNSSVFYHCDEGDGGCVAIDPKDTHNVIHGYYDATPTRSTFAGRFGSWETIEYGLEGDSLFYPPFALNRSNPQQIAFGTDQLFLDNSQGTDGWPVVIALPNLAASLVSAIDYVRSDLLFVGTTSGQVYRLFNAGGVWSVSALHAPPLPSAWIWELTYTDGADPSLTVAMAGYGIAHIWRAQPVAHASGSSAAAWVDISGNGGKRLQIHLSMHWFLRLEIQTLSTSGLKTGFFAR